MKKRNKKKSLHVAYGSDASKTNRQGSKHFCSLGKKQRKEKLARYLVLFTVVKEGQVGRTELCTPVFGENENPFHLEDNGVNLTRARKILLKHHLSLFPEDKDKITEKNVVIYTFERTWKSHFDDKASLYNITFALKDQPENLFDWNIGYPEPIDANNESDIDMIKMELSATGIIHRLNFGNRFPDREITEEDIDIKLITRLR